MFAPIQSTTSSEVRRVDEVRPNKGVTERVPSPLAQTADGVRITIGADARRLASGGSDEGFEDVLAEARSEPSLEDTTETAEQQTSQVYTPNRRVSAFGSNPQNPSDAKSLAAEAASEFDNRALQSFVDKDASSKASSSSGADDEFETFSVAAESSTLPFEVLQRAVTQATGRGAAPTKTTAKTTAAEPLEPLFAAPENGGEPFGRKVPFESEGRDTPPQLPLVSSSETGASGGSTRLSRSEAERVVADLSWSLPAEPGASLTSAGA